MQHPEQLIRNDLVCAWLGLCKANSVQCALPSLFCGKRVGGYLCALDSMLQLGCCQWLNSSDCTSGSDCDQKQAVAPCWPTMH